MKGNELNRGNLLWESSRMFLIEHREQLIDQRRKQKEYVPPVLDEQKLDELNQLLNQAYQDDRVVIATYVGKYEPKTFSGFVERVDLHARKFLLVNGTYEKWLSFQTTLNIEWA
ncbi:YolD-like family protein [Thermoactinomyces sp. DSM 45892]|uniref:YolD-like family protein n=1 Tax=Thermoactinomyces sp. DSM 45892 TaxID=1882753 RepID=UPI00089B5797|nr:YolD-like family protein [Thermoactinomyces sp. DSM 45892]SDZ35502.1 YolD-like protein [Thermoactinomyces sp. DSM 45892]